MSQLLVPCVPANYYARFFANVVAMPALLLGVVAVTWMVDTRLARARARKTAGPSFNVIRHDQERQSWVRPAYRSDMYFAFFLVCESSILLGGKLAFEECEIAPAVRRSDNIRYIVWAFSLQTTRPCTMGTSYCI